MMINKVEKENKKLVEDFVSKEWKKFNKEKNYVYDEEELEYSFIKDNDIYGYLKMKITGSVGYLSQIIVRKDKRKEGVGKELVKKFEEICKEKGCHKVYLETSERHEEALKFYERLGYKKVSTLKNHKFGFTWYILEKTL